MWLSFFSIVAAASIGFSVAALVVQAVGQDDSLHG